jgi:propanediol utilization protein
MDKQTMDDLASRVMARVFVEMEASGRHVHLTQDQIMTLFGHELTPAKPLSQPGQFAARERVTVVGPKGELKNVAVLGPARKEGQVELSLTDARALGLSVPVRQSGDVKDSPGMNLIGPAGQLRLERGAIAAQRHIHLTPADAARFGVKDKQTVKLQTFTARPLVFADVVVRVSPDFAPRVHLDYDEANACGFVNGDLGRILS